jgi:hypothetical protein
MATPESGYDVIIAYSDTQDFLSASVRIRAFGQCLTG